MVDRGGEDVVGVVRGGMKGVDADLGGRWGRWVGRIRGVSRSGLNPEAYPAWMQLILPARDAARDPNRGL